MKSAKKQVGPGVSVVYVGSRMAGGLGLVLVLTMWAEGCVGMGVKSGFARWEKRGSYL